MVPGLGGHYNEPKYAGSLSERFGFSKMTTKGEKVGWLSQSYGSSIAQCCMNPPCPPNEMVRKRGSGCVHMFCAKAFFLFFSSLARTHDQVDAWGSVKASTVQGTDATMFGKRVRPHDTLTTWTTETNRTTLLIKPYLPGDKQNVVRSWLSLAACRSKRGVACMITLALAAAAAEAPWSAPLAVQGRPQAAGKRDDEPQKLCLLCVRPLWTRQHHAVRRGRSDLSFKAALSGRLGLYAKQPV